jgi:hypothetical protein
MASTKKDSSATDRAAPAIRRDCDARKAEAVAAKRRTVEQMDYTTLQDG